MLLVNIIGAGHLGKTIGHLLVKNQAARIGVICNRSEESANQAIQFIGQGSYCSAISQLPPADFTFISTPDDKIFQACEELSRNNRLKPGSIILHCSGALSSDILISMKQKGCYIASVHPMKSFAKPELSIKDYEGTYCAIEGDEEAIPKVMALFNAISSIVFTINKSKKSLYHAAGVFASNYLVTIAEQAYLCMKEADVEQELAMQVILNLMRGTISNLENNLSPKQSLTGPIQRGDISTLLNHLEALSPNQKKLYSALGKATLDLTSHNKEKKEEIAQYLLQQE